MKPFHCYSVCTEFIILISMNSFHSLIQLALRQCLVHGQMLSQLGTVKLKLMETHFVVDHVLACVGCVFMYQWAMSC